MYNRQYQLWPTNQYQTSNVTQVMSHHSTPSQPSYQESNQVAGWDTVPYAGGGHASQVQRQQEHHGSPYSQGNDPHHSSELQHQQHYQQPQQHQQPQHQQQQQQQDSYSGGQYQGHSYYGSSDNYSQEGWANYNNSNTSEQYSDYSQYSQSDASYDNMNQSGQSGMSSMYEQNQGNYSQSNAYNANGYNASYESPLKVLDDRRTNESSAYNVPTSFYSKKLGTGSSYEKKRGEQQDFRRPPPIKYDPSTPADIVAKFKTNHCLMCDVKLNSRVQSQTHYEGKPHAKKLKAVLDKRFGRTPGVEEHTNTNLSDVPTTSDAPSTPEVVVSAPETPKSILAASGIPMGFVGKSGALKGFVASSTGNLSTGLPPVAEGTNTGGTLVMRNSGVKTGLGFVSNSSKKKNKKKKKRSFDGPGEDNSDASSAARKKKKAITDFSQLYCKCCDLSFTSQEHAREHFMGRNHERVLHGLKPLRSGYFNKETGKWQRSPNDPITPTELIKKGPDGKVDADSVKGKGKFFCDVCGVAATSSTQLEMHEKGVRHQQMKMKARGLAAAAGGAVATSKMGGDLAQNSASSSEKIGNTDDGSSLPMSFFSNKLGPSAEVGGTDEEYQTRT
ncbi:hypothetical protein Avbf_06048 [Armadillidium vulgare]|nr:hypothetical protein Avbf_06048 [Armadillidium vulgare]